MAFTFNLEHKRDTTYKFWPQDIKLGENSRFEAPTDQEIEDMVGNFERDGQKTPVVVRKLSKDVVELVAGYCRHAAALRYNERHPDEPMQLRCEVREINDKEAFEESIEENRARRDTSPMDDAWAHRILRDKYQYKDVEIAVRYKMSPTHISNLRKLLTLPHDIQQKIHRREITVQAALQLHSVDPSTQKEIVEKATSENGKVDTGVVLEEVRAQIQEKNKSEEGPKEKNTSGARPPITPPARTISELRKFLQKNKENEGKPKCNQLMEAFLAFVKAEITGEELLSECQELLEE